jgi:hypothetical protein
MLAIQCGFQNALNMIKQSDDDASEKKKPAKKTVSSSKERSQQKARTNRGDMAAILHRPSGRMASSPAVSSALSNRAGRSGDIFGAMMKRAPSLPSMTASQARKAPSLLPLIKKLFNPGMAIGSPGLRRGF